MQSVIRNYESRRGVADRPAQEVQLEITELQRTHTDTHPAVFLFFNEFPLDS